MLPSARGTLRTIAVSLGDCSKSDAEAALLGLLNFECYWDVTWAATTALSKIGGSNILSFLVENGPKSSYSRNSHFKHCISYMQTRIGGSAILLSGDDDALFVQATEAVRGRDWGRARFFLEKLIGNINRGHSKFLR